MTTATVSRFHNYSNGALADAIGALADRRKAIESEERALKDEFRRRGCDRAAGEHFAVWIERDAAWILDTALLKQTIGEEEYAGYCKVQGRTRVRTAPANGEAPTAH